MRLSVLALIAAAIVFVLTADEANAGPIRDRIRNARPGVIIPKRTNAKNAPVNVAAGNACSGSQVMEIMQPAQESVGNSASCGASGCSNSAHGGPIRRIFSRFR